MARVNRFTVDYQLDGMWFRVEFFHQHVRQLKRKLTKVIDGITYTAEVLVEDPKGIPNQVATIHVPAEGATLKERTFPQRIRHITRCKLTFRDSDTVFGEGEAKCSMSDKYIAAKGVGLSFIRAIDDAIPDMPRARRSHSLAFWRAYDQRPESTALVAQVRATVVGQPLAATPDQRSVAPPVSQPGDSRRRTPPAEAFKLAARMPPMHAMPPGFVNFTNEHGVNLLLSPAQARLRNMDPAGDVIEGELIASVAVEPTAEKQEAISDPFNRV